MGTVRMTEPIYSSDDSIAMPTFVSESDQSPQESLQQKELSATQPPQKAPQEQEQEQEQNAFLSYLQSVGGASEEDEKEEEEETEEKEEEKIRFRERMEYVRKNMKAKLVQFEAEQIARIQQERVQTQPRTYLDDELEATQFLTEHISTFNETLHGLALASKWAPKKYAKYMPTLDNCDVFGQRLFILTFLILGKMRSVACMSVLHLVIHAMSWIVPVSWVLTLHVLLVCVSFCTTTWFGDKGEGIHLFMSSLFRITPMHKTRFNNFVLCMHMIYLAHLHLLLAAFISNSHTLSIVWWTLNYVICVLLSYHPSTFEAYTKLLQLVILSAWDQAFIHTPTWVCVSCGIIYVAIQWNHNIRQVVEEIHHHHGDSNPLIQRHQTGTLLLCLLGATPYLMLGTFDWTVEDWMNPIRFVAAMTPFVTIFALPSAASHTQQFSTKTVLYGWLASSVIFASNLMHHSVIVHAILHTLALLAFTLSVQDGISHMMNERPASVQALA